MKEFITTKCNSTNVPSEKSDTDAYVSCALDAAWTMARGDWDELVTIVKNGLQDEVSSNSFVLLSFLILLSTIYYLNKYEYHIACVYKCASVY